MHDDAYVGRRSENNTNASCMTISGGRTKQLDIFCRITGFTSDFLSFLVVELIRFFLGSHSIMSQMTLPHLQIIFNHSIKNYWLVCNQPFSVLFFLQNDIVVTSLAHR